MTHTSLVAARLEFSCAKCGPKLKIIMPPLLWAYQTRTEASLRQQIGQRWLITHTATGHIDEHRLADPGL